MILISASNQMVLEKFAGKKLFRINNMFVTKDGSCGFRTSGIISETTINNQVTFHTNNSVYVFSLADEKPAGVKFQPLFSLENAVVANH